MSDLNEKYKKMLNQDSHIDSGQGFNSEADKELYDYNKRIIESQIGKKAEEKKEPKHEEIKVNYDYEYGDTSDEEKAAEERFKISKNDDSYNTNEKSLSEILFSRFIFLFIVAIISCSIMFGKINNYVRPNNTVAVIEPQVVSTEKEVETVKTDYIPLDLTNQYYLNPIKTEVYNFTDGSFSENCEFVQIDGLRNETVEEKINDKLYEEADKLRKEIMKQNPNASDYILQSYVAANFGNMISVRYYCYAIENITTNDVRTSNWYGGTNVVTLSLVDGRELFLDDIFATEHLKTILMGSSYKYYVQRHTEVKSQDDLVLTQSSASAQIEEEQYDLAYKVINNIKKYKILVMPHGVSLFVRNGNTGYDLVITTNEDMQNSNLWEEITINFVDYYDKIILFDKNKENNLYDGKYMALGPFELFTNSINVIDKIYETTEDHHIDYTICKLNSKSIPQEVQKTISTYVSEKLSDLMKKAREDQSDYTVLSGHVEVSFDNTVNNNTETTDDKISSQGRYECSGVINVIYTSSTKFKKTIYPNTMKWARKTSETMGIDYYDNDGLIQNVKYVQINVGIDNLGNIITEDGKSVLPGIED